MQSDVKHLFYPTRQTTKRTGQDIVYGLVGSGGNKVRHPRSQAAPRIPDKFSSLAPQCFIRFPLFKQC